MYFGLFWNVLKINISFQFFVSAIDEFFAALVDRLARELSISEHLRIYLASEGINLISAQTGENITEITLNDPMRKALVQIQGVIAELDKPLLVKKLRKTRERKRAEQGKCEGRKGYKDAENVHILKLIKKLRRNPRSQGKRRMGYKEVAERLNEMGLRTVTGKEFSSNIIGGKVVVKVRITFLVEKHVDHVFELISDIANYSRWVPEKSKFFIENEITSEGSIGLGTTYFDRLKWYGKAI